MVDFRKRIAGKKSGAVTDPLKLYETLDRAHDKGPLRPAQIAVLKEWSSSRRNDRDVIVKLHTGQGKTLTGLLILQARINENRAPVVYLCPDNFLVEQTCEQARQFGIATCTVDPDLPQEFLDGRKILVTSVQKLFNGLTKFGLYTQSIAVGTVLMDDAHACSDIIRDACGIRIPKEDACYHSLKTLFAGELEQQGVGSYAEICNEKYDAILPVPYWAWIEHESDIAHILSQGSARNPIKYTWPLLKNMLGHCQCIVSGAAIEIEPYVPPLEAFGTYWKAPHRVFMSATVTDDAFLVKGLQLSPETIKSPLTYEKERWSGEKMILLPSLIHESLTRTELVNLFAKPNQNRKSGIVVLAPSFNNTKDWQQYGAVIAKRDTVQEIIENLWRGKFEHTVVLANRYDGIDLPDDTCRILVFDGKPYSESLVDLHQEGCRPESEMTLMRTVRTVEQGLGRSVRGEKDYSVIVITGTELTRLLRNKKSRRFFSNQMAIQVEIGLEIAEMVRQDDDEDEEPMKVFQDLIRQCVRREQDWKAFYAERMESVRPSGPNKRVLEIYAAELRAEQRYRGGDYEGAASEVQSLLDADVVSPSDRGWYLQEMARYNYRSRRPESQKLQLSAYNSNPLLLRPPAGVTVAKLTIVSQSRMERIVQWLSQYENYQELDVILSDILGRLVFGAKAEMFEQALDELSHALGFMGERPDKVWKEGPDNLWALDDTQYVLWECKNEVDLKRSEINKHETEQMNRSCAWFSKHYAGCSVKNIIVHAARNVASAAAFIQEVEVMREKELLRLVKKAREFFKSFESLNFKDLSPAHTQKLVDSHELSVASLLSAYTVKVKNVK